VSSKPWTTSSQRNSNASMRQERCRKTFWTFFSQDNLNGKTKKQILDLINDDKMERLHEKLSHSTDAVDQVRARTIVCLQLARSRWRGIEALQSALDFHSSHVTEDQEGTQAKSERSCFPEPPCDGVDHLLGVV